MALMGSRSSGYRNWLNYNNVKGDNKEVETSFNWELVFTKKPTGIYLPPDMIMNTRLLQVTPPALAAGGLSPVAVGGGYQVYQPMLNDYNNGIFDATYQDFIDQSIEYAFRELVYEYDRPIDRTSKPKAECLWDAELYQLDSQDRPVKKYVMKDCLLETFNKTDTMDYSKTPGGQVTISWHAYIWWIEQMNVATA